MFRKICPVLFNLIDMQVETGADLGGAQLPLVQTLASSDIWPPHYPSHPSPPKSPLTTTSFVHFYDIHFRPILKFCLRRFAAPKYTNFEGERAPKKRSFLSQLSENC